MPRSVVRIAIVGQLAFGLRSLRGGRSPLPAHSPSISSVPTRGAAMRPRFRSLCDGRKEHAFPAVGFGRRRRPPDHAARWPEGHGDRRRISSTRTPSSRGRARTLMCRRKPHESVPPPSSLAPSERRHRPGPRPPWLPPRSRPFERPDLTSSPSVVALRIRECVGAVIEIPCPSTTRTLSPAQCVHSDIFLFPSTLLEFSSRKVAETAGPAETGSPRDDRVPDADMES